MEVLKGNVPGHQLIHIHGHNGNVGTTIIDLWGNASKLVYLSAAEQMNIASDSASDASAGVGARTVQIRGVDANFVKITENITMNGTTDVLTTKSFLRVVQIVVLTVGTSLENVGSITATADTAATLQDVLEPTLNHSTSAHYTSPAGKFAVFSAYELNVGMGKDAIIDIRAGVGTAVLETIHRNHVFEAPFVSPIHDAILPPKTDLVFRVNLTTGSAAGIAGSVNIVEIDERFVDASNITTF